MASFIKDYLEHLRKSDKKTKHKSALFLSFIFSIVTLLIIFLIFKDSILDISPSNSQNTKEEIAYATDTKDISNENNNIVSPLTSLSNFLKILESKFQI